MSQKARARALRLLARRALSTKELQQKLAASDLPREAVDEAMAMVERLGYLDDEAVAEAVVRRAARELRGPYWVSQRLAARGIAADMATRHAQVAKSTAKNVALAAYHKRFGTAPPALQARARAMRFLLGRGFSYACALEVIRGVADAGEGCSD